MPRPRLDLVGSLQDFADYEAIASDGDTFSPQEERGFREIEEIETGASLSRMRRNHHLSGILPVTFADGGRDYALKYACDTCHVDMNRTEKTRLHHVIERSRDSRWAGEHSA